MGPELGRCQDGNDFEIYQVLPTVNPRIERLAIGRLHDLVAAGTGPLHPTCLVGDAFGKHATASVETRADGLRIALFEPLDDHKKHGESVAEAEMAWAGAVMAIIDRESARCYKHLLCAGGVRSLGLLRRCKMNSDAAKSALLILCLAVEAWSELWWLVCFMG